MRRTWGSCFVTCTRGASQMSESEGTIHAVESVLQLVLRSDGGSRFHLAAAQSSLRALSGAGITYVGPEPTAQWDESYMDATEQERTPVEVDARRVLEEGVSQWGYSVAPFDARCLRLTHPEVPESKCIVVVPLVRSLGAVQLRAQIHAPLIVRVHLGEFPSAAESVVERSLGIVSIRLRSLGELNIEALDVAVSVATAATAVFGSAGAPKAESVSALHAVPERVVEYANTADAGNFESATAQILDGFVDLVLPLGARHAGKPVPDGLVLHESGRGSKIEVGLYDCKSKKDGRAYSFAPEDGDQFSRYDEILSRCEEQGWEAKGIMVATSDADIEQLNEKVLKDIWARLMKRRLIIVPSAVLLRWHQLSASHGPAFRGRFDSRAVWSSLWDQQLPEGIPPQRQSRYFPQRDVPYRVLTLEEAELVWLAGATKVRASVATAFAELQRASLDDRIEPHKKPQVIDDIVRLLGDRKGLTIKEIANATGLTHRAVEFLIEGKAIGDVAPEDIGSHFAANLKTLRRAVLAE